jgi:glycosyltransferase involved in cell wall biosynthesis
MSRRFRVAVVAACPFLAARGTPIRIHRIAEQLGRRGHEVDVFTYHLGATADDAPFRVLRIANVPTYHKETPGPSYQKVLVLDPLLAVKLAGALRRKRYDVIHAHHAEGLLAAAAARMFRHVPLVFDVHTLLQSELPYYRMGLSRPMLRRVGGFLDRLLPKFADEVIAVSEDIRSNLIEVGGCVPGRMTLIPNGVEDMFCRTAPRDTSGCTHQGPRLVYAGTLASYQRVDLLLQAFAISLQHRPDLWLHIYTQGSFEPYERLARELSVRERVCLRNVSLQDLPGNLAAADVAVNPRIECAGMPQKLGNYMAAGCAIVTFAGSAKHVVAGETGMVIANGDVGAFADAILLLVSDRSLAHRLGAQARNFARAELSWPRVAERTEGVYARAVEDAAGR